MKVVVRPSPFTQKGLFVYVTFNDEDFKSHVLEDDLWGDDMIFDQELRLDIWGERKAELFHRWLVERKYKTPKIVVTVDDFVYGLRRKFRLNRYHQRRCVGCCMEAAISPWLDVRSSLDDITLPRSKKYSAVGCVFKNEEDFVPPAVVFDFDTPSTDNDSSSED